ncbi:MAG: zinc-dependent metalloprotease [Planctomycetota bacterium]
MSKLLLALLASAAAAACGGAGASRAPEFASPDTRVGTGERGDTATLLPVLLDVEAGTARIRLPAPADGAADGELFRCLHVAGIETGLGANDVGLDRGQMGGARLVRFRRVGGKVLLEQLNTSFRAEAGGPLERAAAAQSFATSVLWGGEPEEVGEDGSVLVDITELLVRDAHGIARTLESTGQGTFTLDAERSALDATRCRAVADNLAFAAIVTFQSAKPGSLARSTAPEGGAITLLQRQGFVRLPDDGFERRRFDPRMGAFSIRYLDYGVPLEDPIEQRFAVRHRLRRDPATGEIEPIVYYVDRAAPEPVRSALVEGASWWAEAFAAAGYPGAFRVEVAPEGFDPLDVRNHVIQWVHRSTRGWSYGNAITDPRTGEILKGHVSLGSLRVRQDRLLFEGLLGRDRTGSGGPDDPVELALARIRQLSAHEVGHTLGLAHNFAASGANRASVMDYPAPRVAVTGTGVLDVSDAYDVGVGAWDVHAIRMLYEDVPAGTDVAAFHEALHMEASEAGLMYLTDADARPAGAAHPFANLWDDGKNPVRGLLEALEVRRIALDRFGRRNLEAGRPLAELEEVFVPLYLHHRYQVDAAVKMIGGATYDHAMNAPSGKTLEPVPMELQRDALEALARTMQPETLQVPPSVRALLLPRPPGYGRSREIFERRAGATFDWMGAAEVAARTTARGLLHPERLLRVELQASSILERDAQRFDARTVVMGVFGVMRASVIDTREVDDETRALRALAMGVLVEEALRTYRAPGTARPVRSALREALQSFAKDGALVSRGQLQGLRAEVNKTLGRRLAVDERGPDDATPSTPPGSPIGAPAGTLHGSEIGTTMGCDAAWPTILPR